MKHALKNMKLEKQEIEKPVESLMSAAPEYPYGLCLHIDNEIYKKLQMAEPPEIGQKLDVMAQATVVGVNLDSGPSGSKVSFRLQITDLGLKSAEKKDVKEIEKSLYGNVEEIED